MTKKEIVKILQDVPNDCRIDFMLCPTQNADDDRDDINLNCIGEIYSYSKDLNFVEIGFKCDTINTIIRHCGELKTDNYIIKEYK